MTAFFEWLKIYKDSIYSIVIFLTFIVSICSMFFTIKNNKAIHYVNSITKNRVEWINTLRDTISDFIAHTNIHNNVYFRGNFEKSGLYLSESQKLCSKIKLLLNCCDDKDWEIINLVDSILDNYREYVDSVHDMKIIDGYFVETDKSKKHRNKVEHDIKELTKKTQLYLKNEWNRVKYESRGKIYDTKVQAFDYQELEKKYDNHQYITNNKMRLKLQLRCKAEKVLAFPQNIFLAIIVLFILSIIIIA